MMLRTATPTARKPHRCEWCYTTIQPGEKYHRSTNIYDGRLYDWVACAACDALCPVVWEWAYRPDEGVGEDTFADWAEEHRDDAEFGEQAGAYGARRALAATRLPPAPTAERVAEGEGA